MTGGKGARRSNGRGSQWPIEGCFQSGGGARLDIGRRLQPTAEMPAHQILEGRPGLEPALASEPVEPALARGDMADLLAIDHLEGGGARLIAMAAQGGDHDRRDIEA